jgi:hypothetical protein
VRSTAVSRTAPDFHLFEREARFHLWRPDVSSLSTAVLNHSHNSAWVIRRLRILLRVALAPLAASHRPSWSARYDQRTSFVYVTHDDNRPYGAIGAPTRAVDAILRLLGMLNR